MGAGSYTRTASVQNARIPPGHDASGLRIARPLLPDRPRDSTAFSLAEEPASLEPYEKAAETVTSDNRALNATLTGYWRAREGVTVLKRINDWKPAWSLVLVSSAPGSTAKLTYWLAVNSSEVWSGTKVETWRTPAITSGTFALAANQSGRRLLQLCPTVLERGPRKRNSPLLSRIYTIGCCGDGSIRRGGSP